MEVIEYQYDAPDEPSDFYVEVTRNVGPHARDFALVTSYGPFDTFDKAHEKMCEIAYMVVENEIMDR